MERSSIKSTKSPNGNLPKTKLYDIFCGEVASVQTYGAFVKIPGCPHQGLVHVSQMSHMRVENASDILTKGETIYCKVINIDTDGDKTKIGLSMKLVNQTTGHDTDPNNVELSLDRNKRRPGGKRDFEKIELGAFLDTTCRKCGGKGHLAQDCFGDGKKYDLIPEFGDDDLMTSTQEGSSQSHDSSHQHRKQKKLKKDKTEHKHKKKRRKRDTDSSAENSSDTVKTHHRHKSPNRQKPRHRQKHIGKSSDQQ